MSRKRKNSEKWERIIDKKRRFLDDDDLGKRIYLLKQWHPVMNEHLPAFQTYSLGSRQKAWWICEASKCEHKHIWKASMRQRSSGSDCPYCSGKRICICMSIVKTHPDVADFWDLKKNGDLRPEDFISGSNKRVWFWCKASSCDHHKWEGSITNAIRGGCPFCREFRGHRKICPCNSLATLESKIASEWHHEKNGSLKPEQVSPGSACKVWWKCQNHKTCDEHVWRATISSRKVSSCPFCVVKRPRPCSCYNFERLASKEVLAEWHPDNKPAKEYTPQSNKTVLWKCKRSTSHPDWTASINARYLGYSNCTECCQTQSNGERETQSVLFRIFQVRCNKQVPGNLPPLSLKAPLRFDFIVVPQKGKFDRHCAIEYDGQQHFKPHPRWSEDVTKRDRLKNLYAAQNKIHLLRIGYTIKGDFEPVIRNFFSRVIQASSEETIIQLEGTEYNVEYKQNMF